MIFVILVFLAVAILFLLLFFNIVLSILENIYALIFGKPFYIHFYYPKKQLSDKQQHILRSKILFYKNLTDKEKIYFEHRVYKFIYNYQFIGREGLLITDEIKILIAATSIMMTFGMRVYLYTAIDKIIVYPETYFSKFSNGYHKGEFNPMLRAVVFSWEDFMAGFNISNNNLNLGIHEFSHVLHYQSLKATDLSATIFTKHFYQIRKEIQQTKNKQKLIQSDYFRIYAYTNDFEFLAVIMEHYFETPEMFKVEFPELYVNVGKMLNAKR